MKRLQLLQFDKQEKKKTFNKAFCIKDSLSFNLMIHITANKRLEIGTN